jgi:GNAT superfamily N-acetyltransferase
VSTWRPPVAFDPTRHRTEDFSCGEERLDRWLQAYAGQGERRDASRTFVTTDDADRVVGYYTLVAGQVEHEDASPDARRGLSRHFPIPICLLARLAVDERCHGRGLGAALLADALGRAVRAAEQVGIRAVLVNAIHDRAAAFYVRFGFEPISDDGRTLMLNVGRIRAAMEAR